MRGNWAREARSHDVCLVIDDVLLSSVTPLFPFFLLSAM